MTYVNSEKVRSKPCVIISNNLSLFKHCVIYITVISSSHNEILNLGHGVSDIEHDKGKR